MFQGYVGKFLEPPKNGWLELDPFLLGQKAYFSRAKMLVSERLLTGDDPPSRNFFGFHQETQLHRPLIHPIHW